MKLLTCAILYALIDYLAYGLVQDERHEASFAYRVFQVVWCWIPIMCWLDTWGERLAFFLLWWTFTLDWLYYVFTVQPFGDMFARFLRKRFGFPRIGWDDWADTVSDWQNGITHAYWTPAGILIGFNKTKAIDPLHLIIQSFLGIYLSFIL